MKTGQLNLPYLIPRLARHFLPEKLVRALLLRSIIIRPGMETSNPLGAVKRYVDVLSERGASFHDKSVLVFGYGGRFDIGFGLLKEGAARVILCDKYAPPDEAHNQQHVRRREQIFRQRTCRTSSPPGMDATAAGRYSRCSDSKRHRTG